MDVIRIYAKKKHPERNMPEASPAQTKSNQPAELLVQKAYYITAKQYRALKLRAAIGEEKDMSAIVRAALDAYLAI